MTRELMQIGEVAKAAGVTVRTVRYYLEKGFIQAAERSPGGFYLFHPQAVETVHLIQMLAGLGMPLNQIKELFQIRRREETGDQAYPQVLERLRHQLQLTEKRIQEYTRLKEEIKRACQLVERCRGCDKKPNRENCSSCPVTSDFDPLPLPFGAIL